MEKQTKSEPFPVSDGVIKPDIYGTLARSNKSNPVRRLILFSNYELCLLPLFYILSDPVGKTSMDLHSAMRDEALFLFRSLYFHAPE